MVGLRQTLLQAALSPASLFMFRNPDSKIRYEQLQQAVATINWYGHVCLQNRLEIVKREQISSKPENVRTRSAEVAEQ